MSEIVSIDPRTEGVREVVTTATSRSELNRICGRAEVAFEAMGEHDRHWRSALLRACADGLEAARVQLVAVADAETALGTTRLNGELTRTCFQLRLFADAVDEGSYLEATIDHAGETAMGARPDLRRMLVPLGPVAVFGASNFPLAFSVPGGDTASALAAGCPVVAKAHESHPATSKLCAEVMERAIIGAGGPDGAISVVYGREPGGWLVQHPAITAVGFTGSLTAARALMNLIDQRDVPIPFYGELGSVNPLVVTCGAAEERPEQIGQGLAASMSLGVGQFCTKPGLAFVPSGVEGDRLVASATQAVSTTPAGVMLNANIRGSFGKGIEELTANPAIREIAIGQAPEGHQAVSPRLLEVELEDLNTRMLEECFGPVTVIARYRDQDSLVGVLTGLPASLTSTVHATEAEHLDPKLTSALRAKAGRLVYNGFPTGVAVAWAQTHGGGWPASNAIHTSVGVTAIRRFMRPFTWQDAPEAILPVELKESPQALPRRIDGSLRPSEE